MRRLLEKELKTLLREPMVIAMIILPLVIYSAMTPFYGATSEQIRKAAELRGAKLALAVCPESPAQTTMLNVIAAGLQASNVSVDVVETCNPVELLKTDRYDAIMMLNVADGKIAVDVYVRGKLSQLAHTLALPGSISSRIARALSPSGNITSNAYILLNDRLWSINELSNVHGAGITLGYATFFILFPAASLGATLIGAEREERMLEVLFSLPVSRRRIALSKAIAALIVAILAAISAMAGLYQLFSSVGVNLDLTKYYTLTDMLVYVAALASEAFFVVILSMLVGMFASTVRGAQSAAPIVVIPAIVPTVMTMTGIPASKIFTLLPYTAVIYAGMSPLIGLDYAVTATIVQLAETLLVLVVLLKALESETAVIGPETLRRFRARIAARFRSRRVAPRNP